MDTIIFDWDGTLARTLDLWVDGFHRAFARRDLRYDAATIVAEFFHDHHLVPDRHPHLDFAAIADETRSYVHAAAATVALYDGARGLLQALTDQGFGLALVSSSARALLERGLGAHGLAGFFGSIIAGDDGFGHKPDPGPLVETLGRMGADPACTLVIGDSHVDVMAGRAAGCRTCWFAPPENRLFHDFDRIAGLGADHAVSDLTGLLAHVRR